MIRMHVRADNALDRLTGHEVVKQTCPLCFGGVEVEAGVNDGPTIAILKQPQINVVQRAGHREPHPPDTRSHLKRLVARVL